jgi:hypothetical protein
MYCESAFVAFGIQYALRMRHIVIYGLSGSTIFFNIIIYCDIFVNCNWVVTRWQQYSTHLHTNNT